MDKIEESQNTVLFWLLDLFILCISFFVTFKLFQYSVNVDTNIHTLTIICVCLAFVLVRLSKRVVAKTLALSSEILKISCGNAFGLFCSVVVFFIMSYYLPSINAILPIVIVSSLASFFIMGTLIPATKCIIKSNIKQNSF